MTPSTRTPIAVDAVARPAPEAADIVQRLNLVSFCTENIFYPPVAATAAEAADTITALRSRVAELEGQYEPIAWQWLDSMQMRRKLPGDAEKGAWRRVYAVKSYRGE